MALTDIYTTPSLLASLSTAGTTTGLIFGTAIDLSVARDIGEGEPLHAVIRITTAVTSGGSATVGFNLVTADDSALTTNATLLTVLTPIAKASLIAGYKFPIITLPKGLQYQRYLGFHQVIGTAALTAGKATAAIVRDAQNWYAYNDNAN